MAADDDAEASRCLSDNACKPSVGGGGVVDLTTSGVALRDSVSVGEGERREDMEEMVMLL